MYNFEGVPTFRLCRARRTARERFIILSFLEKNYIVFLSRVLGILEAKYTFPISTYSAQQSDKIM